jgi:hypothetical protein
MDDASRDRRPLAPFPEHPATVGTYCVSLAIRAIANPGGEAAPLARRGKKGTGPAR